MPSPWIRRTVLALGALLLALLLAVGWLVASFDGERSKALAVDWVKREHQRQLVVSGPVSLSFFPRLAVSVQGVQLSERGVDGSFLTVDEAALAVRVLPLLSGQLVVDRVRARGLKASLRRDADGASSIDDLLPGHAGAQPPADESTPSSLRFDISGIELEDLTLQVHDAMTPVEGELVVKSLSVGRLAPRRPAPLSVDAQLRLSQPRPVDLQLKGALTLSLDADQGALSVSDLRLQALGGVAAVQAIDLVAEGALGWDGKSASAGPLQLHLTRLQHGALSLEASTLSLTRAHYDAQAEQLSLDALKLALTGRQAEQTFQLALDWPSLAVAAERVSGSGFQGSLELTGPLSGQARFASAAPGGSFKALQLPKLKLDWDGGSGAHKLVAELETDLRVEPEKTTATLEPLALKATLRGEGLPDVAAALGGSLSASAAEARWAVQGTLNEDRFDSRGLLRPGAAAPYIEARARFDALDLNRWLPPPTASGGAPAEADPQVPLEGLKAVDGRFSLHAGRLVLRQYEVADAQVEASLDGGRLTVESLSGRAWGGQLRASGSADASAQRVALKLDARDVDVEALLKDVAGKDLLEGSGRVDADLQAQGATLGALRSSLAGRAAVQLRDGAVKGVNLARAMRQAKAALSQKADALNQASATEKTDFSALSASARVDQGVAVSDDLELKSPFLRVGGAGRFDVGRGQIDYTARATVVAAPTGQGSAELKALQGVTVPVRLAGPFDNIGWTIQWSEVAADVVKKRVQDKLTEQLGKKLGIPSGAASAPADPKDKLKEVLKGLFR